MQSPLLSVGQDKGWRLHTYHLIPAYPRTNCPCKVVDGQDNNKGEEAEDTEQYNDVEVQGEVKGGIGTTPMTDITGPNKTSSQMTFLVQGQHNQKLILVCFTTLHVYVCTWYLMMHAHTHTRTHAHIQAASKAIPMPLCATFNPKAVTLISF